MFRSLRQTMTRRFTPRKERTDGVRPRGQLERLEDRAMLSASYGTMSHNHVAPTFDPHGGVRLQKFNYSAAVASQQYQQPVSYELQSFSNVGDSGFAYR